MSPILSPKLLSRLLIGLTFSVIFFGGPIVTAAQNESTLLSRHTVGRSEAVIVRSVAEPRQESRTSRPAVRNRTETPTIIPEHVVHQSEERQSEPTRITLGELAILQLAAHDLFDVDRETEVDHENGKLDLSTLLNHGSQNIVLGGEPRNRENIFLFTISSQYGELYQRYVEKGLTEQEAYQRLLLRYHKELANAYEQAFSEPLPEPVVGTSTMTQNVALRTIHDLLPGTIMVDGEEIETVDPSLLGMKLSRYELSALSSPLDGVLDEEFRDVVIIIPPDNVMHIDLLERDESFAEQFGAEHTFSHFMSELADGSYGSNEDVMSFIRALFAQARSF